MGFSCSGALVSAGFVNVVLYKSIIRMTIFPVNPEPLSLPYIHFILPVFLSIKALVGTNIDCTAFLNCWFSAQARNKSSYHFLNGAGSCFNGTFSFIFTKYCFIYFLYWSRSKPSIVSAFISSEVIYS